MAEDTSTPRALPLSPPSGARRDAAIAFALLFFPLFGLGLVWCIDNGAERSIDRAFQETAFQVVLKFGMRRAQADDLGQKWRKSVLWEKVETLAPYALLGEVDELGDWATREENRDVVMLMPYVVELRPAAGCDYRELESVVREMKKHPEVDRVVYDREAVSALIRMDWAIRRAGDVLTALMLVFFAASAALLWVGGGLRGWGAWLMVASGLGALIAVTLTHVILRGLHPMGGAFSLTFPQSLILIALGAVAGGGIGFRSRRAAASVTAILLCATVATMSPDAPARETGGLGDLALPAPAPSEGMGMGIGGASGSREERLEAIDTEVAQIRRLLEYHDEVLDWDRRDRLDLRRNSQLTRVRIDVLREELQGMRRNVEKRRERLESVVGATVRSRPVAVASGAPGALDRSRQRAAFYILSQTLKQGAFMADVERDRLEEQERDLAKLLREQARLDFFQKAEALSPESIREEKSRLRERMVALLRERSLLRDRPVPLPDTPAEGESTAPERPSDDYVVERRLFRALGVPVVSRRSGHYLFTAPGTLIRAVAGGTVLYADSFRGLGHVVIVDNGGGLSTVYSYLSNEISVRPGQEIKAGQYIGSAGLVRRYGTAGVRFEVRRDGELTDLKELPGVDAVQLETLLRGGQ